MIKFYPFIGVLGALAACAANAHAADSSSTSVSLSGSAPKKCEFTSGATVASSQNMDLDQAGSAGNNVITIVSVDELVDPATALLNPSSIEFEYKAVCNYSHVVSIRSTKDGLKSVVNTAVPGFVSTVNYQALVSWGTKNKSFFTSGTVPGRTVTVSPVPPFTGTARITLTIDEPFADMAHPVIAGDYSDTLTVQIGASL
jgi:hypothetical protein